MEDEGTIAIADALKSSNSTIQIIEMAGNNITCDSAKSLAELITAKKHSLTKINLSENELRDEGAIAIGKALEEEFGQLCIVDLSANSIRSDGARTLAKAVVGKLRFRLLNVNGNMLSYEGINEVREIFKDFPRMLGPLDNNHEGDDYDELESKLKDLEMKQKR